MKQMVRQEIENRNKGQGRMMEKPTMTEDLLRIVNKQKHEKAAEVDGVKAEAMNHMVKNKKI